MKKIILFFAMILSGVLVASAALPLNDNGCTGLQTRMMKKNIPAKIAGLYNSLKLEQTQFTKDHKYVRPEYNGICYLNGVKQVRISFGNDDHNIQPDSKITTLEFYTNNVYVMIDGVKVTVGTPIATLQKLKSATPNYNSSIFFYGCLNIYVRNGKVTSIVVGLFPTIKK